MKIYLLMILVITLFLCPVHGQGEFLINGRFQAIPLVFEPKYNILGIDMGTAWKFGYYTNSYMIGLGASFDYTLYDNMEETENLQGEWLHTRVLLEQEYTITPGVKTHWAAGGIWLNNTIAFGTTETQVTDFYGLSFDLDLKFRLPVKFLIMELLNRVDLLYSLDSDFTLTNMAPHYYGGIRLYVDFGVQWFQLYLEAQGHYWNYRGTGYTINTGIARSGLGLCLNIPPIKLKKNEIINGDVNPLDPASGDSNSLKAKIDPQVELLKTVVHGNKVQFYSILFVKYSDELLSVSYTILDQIINVLNKRKGINFTISAYAEYQENPEEEFKLYTSRAKQIKDYLIKGGIEESRLKVSSIGQIVTVYNQKQGSTVIFKAAGDEEIEK